MKTTNLVLVMILFFPLFLSAAEFGTKFEISGGPIFSGIIGIPLNEKLDLEFAAGGFPEIIFRSDANLKFNQERKWFPFYLTGIGVISFYRGNADGKTIVTFQANAAIRTFQLSIFKISPYIGILYVPNWLNEDFNDDLADLAIVPMLGVEIMFGK
ncbi:MAG: hypothetical protein P9L97_01820 [Candidatus Tenebribacter davisii]|jgi:hypothetical protein|nr:hypothetical protein [Candidatus Tenebribacter davisii]